MVLLCLVTGGNGYVGSHTCVEALQLGCKVMSLDKVDTLVSQNILKIVPVHNGFKFAKIDLCDFNQLQTYLKTSTQEFLDFFNDVKEIRIVHCASNKSVNESIQNPIAYYKNNMLSTLNLLECLQNKIGFLKIKVQSFIFSSSATVYLNNPHRTTPKRFKTDDEDVGRFIENPYGKSKYFQEEIIKDVAKNSSDTVFVILRYFNPIWSHPSGLLEEDRTAPNIFPQIMKCLESGETLKVYGNDYDTRDGTCIRDYVHVCEVAKSHLINYTGTIIIKNVGSGQGLTVLELIKEVEKTSGKTVKYTFFPRREGDAAEYVGVP
jgi:UDP-glucose 4-epimerase